MKLPRVIGALAALLALVWAAIAAFGERARARARVGAKTRAEEKKVETATAQTSKERSSDMGKTASAPARADVLEAIESAGVDVDLEDLDEGVREQVEGRRRR